MKKFFEKYCSYSLVIDFVCICLFFAPFVVCKGSVTPTVQEYVSGFQAIFGGSHFDGMSIAVLCMLIFIAVALVLNCLARNHKKLSLISFVLECGTGVLLFCVCPLIRYGLNISPSSWIVNIHVGSVIAGCLLCISSLISLGNAFSKN